MNEGIYTTGTFPDGNMVRKKRPETTTHAGASIHQAEEIVRKYSNCREWELVAAIAEILMEQERLWGLLADGKGTS